MSAMYNAGLSSNTDFMTLEEAKKVTSISGIDFSNVKSFDEFKYFTNVTEIPAGFFENNTTLTSIILPESITTIGTGVFLGCTNLVSVTLSKSIKTIPDQCFKSCSKLASITLPTSITKFGTECFYGCGNNLSIHVNSIEQYMNILKGDWMDEWWNLYIGDKLCTEVTIDTSYVQNYLFECCDSLKKVTLTDNVKTIGIGSFMVCRSITELNMSNSVTTIKDYAFYCLRALKSIVLPSTTTSIGYNTFTGCIELSNIYCYATTAPSAILTSFGFSNDAFAEYVGMNNRPNNILYLPQGATGYDTGYWKDPLLISNKCGFTIEYM